MSDTFLDYSLLFEKAPVAMIIISSEGLILNTNRQAESLLGIKKKDALDKLLFTLFDVSDHEIIRKGIHSVKQEGGKKHPVCEVSKYKLSFSPLDDSSQICYIQELFEGKNNSQGNLESFIQKSPNSVAMFDNSMNYIVCSKNWSLEWDFKSKGLNRKSIKGKNHYSIFSDVKEIWKIKHQLGLEGKTLENNRDSFIDSNGNLVWLSWQIRPWYNEKGKVGGILLFTDIITEKVNMEIALKKSEEMLNLFFLQSLDGFFIMEAESPLKLNEGKNKKKAVDDVFNKFHIVKLNNALLKQYEAGYDDMIGLSFNDLFKNNSKVANGIISDLLDKKQQIVITKADTFKSNQIWVEGDYIALFNKEGDLTAIFGMQRDITQRIQDELDLKNLTEGLAKSNTELKQFAYITSHDLRAPVINLRTLISFYDRQLIHQNNKEVFNKIEESVQRLDTTLNDLVDLVAFNEKPHYEAIQIDLKKYVDEIISNIEQEVIQSGTIIKTDFSKVDLFYFSDKYLKSILQNLITNAVKYRSDKRQSKIDISAELSNNNINIRVKDNGIGIDLNKYGDRLFGLYQKFHNGPNSKGLGLFIVKSHVELVGGKIEVESEVDVGSTFKVILPIGK
ncbi:PAS domain S-box protein [Fulvivirga sp.]|uniref:PAS domain S-box protein n=1 Tax=Fulvivirga sp. TaxID=1931237 RepID=UPI0032ED79EF